LWNDLEVLIDGKSFFLAARWVDLNLGKNAIPDFVISGFGYSGCATRILIN
jgi:hypothetical protein